MKLTLWILGIIAGVSVTCVQGFAWAEERYEHRDAADKREKSSVDANAKLAQQINNRVDQAALSAEIEIAKLRKATLDDRVFDLAAKVQVIGASKVGQAEMSSYERYKSERDSIGREIEIKQQTLATLRMMK